MAEGEQRFYAITTIITGPFFLLLWLTVGLITLSEESLQLQGLGITMVCLLGVASSLLWPYVAVVHPDGLIVFKAVSRDITTRAHLIHHISTVQNKGVTHVFHFDNRSARLGWIGGRQLVRYVQAINPEVVVS